MIAVSYTHLDVYKRQALDQLDLKGKKAVLVLSGGNMDVITMSSVVQHGLIQQDRIFTVSVLLPDKAGELVKVAAAIADQNGNVIKLEHNQFEMCIRDSPWRDHTETPRS